MSQHPLVGRVAVLRNLVSTPHLNGSYVLVESHSETNERFTVRTLVKPNDAPSDVLTIAVKLSCLEFSKPDTFTSEYPHAETVAGSLLKNAYLPGTILDFTIAREHRTEKPMMQFQLGFERACQILGSADDVSGAPATVFPDCTVFSPRAPEPNCPMEIHRVHFTHTMICQTGKNITFHSCKFSGVGAVLIQMGAHVVFENCLFENNRMGISLVESSKITLLNCTFKGTDAVQGLGIEANEASSVRAIHCTFYCIHRPITTQPKANVELVNCYFSKSKEICVALLDGSSCSAKGCRWEDNVEHAIHAQGPKRTTTLLVQDSVIKKCGTGVSAAHGKVDITMSNTELSYNLTYGIHLSMDCMGRVTITDCRFVDNIMRGVANLCGVRCVVTIDDVIQSQMNQHQRICQEMGEMKEIADKAIAEMGPNRPTRRNFKGMRLFKESGVCSIKCEYCGKIEPQGVNFSKCGKCKNVCYCTKDCQVTHWKAAHKKECGTILFG